MTIESKNDVKKPVRDYKDLRVWHKAMSTVKQIMDLVEIMPKSISTRVISEQIIKSSTSVCANIVEGHSSGSSKEFARILRIAYREAKETDNWLQIIRQSDKYTNQQIMEAIRAIESSNLDTIKMLSSLRSKISTLTKPAKKSIL